MHLTNYAVNKEGDGFRMPKNIDDDRGHKRTLAKVLARLQQEGHDPDKLMTAIKGIIVKTLLPVQADLAHNYRTCQPSDGEGLMCFEILGFDIILDKDARPFLLEVNHAPSFATDSPLDYEIKRQLFVDSFRLLGLSVEKKRAKVAKMFEDRQNRMISKVPAKQRTQQRKQHLEQLRREQDEHERQN